MRKRTIAALITLIAFSSSIHAYDLEFQGLYYDIDFNSKTMTVVNLRPNNYYANYYAYCSGRITIPSSIKFGDNDYKVTAIGESAFENCSDITAITIPNSITKIGRGAFCNCTSLSRLNIPESISEIDNSAFSYCENIDTLIWDNDNVVFYDWLFEGLPSLKHVIIGKIKTDYRPFEYCENLTSATILDGTTYIQDYLFGGCSGLTDISIPESVASIGDGAFWGCTGLTSIDIPDGVTAIGNTAFKHCSNLKSFIIPAGIKTIENGTFSECSSLSSIIIPESVTRIEANAFEYCSDLSSVVLPDNLSFIGANAFGYSGLTDIDIPAHMDSIGIYYYDNQPYILNPFSGCSNLRSITVDSNNKKYDSRNNCNAIIETASNTLLACANLTTITIPESVTSIGSGAFAGCTDLNSIVIPEGVTRIDGGAFSGCSALSSIQVDPDNTVYDSRENCNAIIETQSNTLLLACKTTIVPETATDIHETAFNGTDWGKDSPDGVIYINDLLYRYKGDMPQGTTITVKDGTRRIASSVFSGCTGLTSINIPESVTSIGSNAFSGCTGLTSINIPESVTDIEMYAFSGCTGLKSISIPGSVENIEQGVFEGCTGLTNVYIQDGVTSIDNSAFQRCRSIKTISIPESMGFIDRWAFDYGCYIDTLIWNSPNISPSVLRNYYDHSIKFVSFGNKVVQIGDNAFSNCSTLDSVVISEGVKAIGERAFSQCWALKSITIPQSVTTIGNEAFSGCSGLKKIVIPETVTNLGGGILDGCNSLPQGAMYINDILYCYIGQMPENTSITVKDGTKSIAAGAFAYYDGLTSITIPNSVTSIGNKAFSGCYNLKSVTIPGSVTTIGSYAFSYCSSLTSIVIPNGVKTIGEGAFYYSSVRTISIPESVTTIGYQAFYDYNGLDTLYWDNISVYPDESMMGSNYYHIKVWIFGNNYIKHRGLTYSAKGTEWYESLPDGPVYLDNWLVGYKGVIPNNTQIEIKQGTIGIATNAFIPTEYDENDGQITSVTIPESVTTIEHGAFFGCGISAITIPKSVNSIGEGPFYNCPYLTTICVDPENSVYDSRENCNAILETATNTLIQGCSNTTIPENVTSIGAEAFSYCTNLTSIVIPDGVTTIGDYAFSNCDNLTSVTLPQGLESIKSNAFLNCTNLTSINIPQSVTTIEWQAFMHCRKLTSITLPDGISVISGGLFDECDSLTYITIPESVTTIENFAFRGCYNLKDINIPSSVKSIGRSAFSGCIGLSSIPDGLTYIGDYAFKGCTGITSVTIPEDITYIGPYAFEYCTGIKTVSLPASMGGKEYEWHFGDCSDIESIYLHSSTPINYYGFYDIDFDNCILYVPAGSKETYRKHSTWSRFKNIRLLDECGLNIDGICYEITSDIEKTVSVVHHNYKGAVIIPSSVIINGTEYSVTGIASEAFSECDELVSVTVPQSVTNIEQGSFEECHALTEIIFKGSPIINKDVFIDCPNIEKVVSTNITPGTMRLYNPFIAGDCETILKDNRNYCSALFDKNSNRYISRHNFIYSNKTIINNGRIPAGEYKVTIGILPSDKPNFFHPVINAYIGDTKQVILDNTSMEEVDFDGWSFTMEVPQYLINDITSYDSVLITDNLIIPDSCNRIEIWLESGVENYQSYSTKLLLDRIFFEPIGNDFPEESYCGPFTESVFNNATLYVPESAVSTYREADGWKLFKNIAIDTKVEPVHMDNRDSTDNPVIYDMLGRKIMSDSLERLQPGLYIINGKKYLKSHM